MNELMNHIYELRKEGIPLHFRRAWDDYKKPPIWYIWYGYTPIAYRANLEKAEKAVHVAAIVHREIYKAALKAA